MVLTRKLMAAAAALLLSATAGQANTVAYEVPAGTTGNQDFTSVLGMLFELNSTINVLSLGVFDSGSDGISGNDTLTVELWSRTGTTGDAILASETFSAASAGTLVGGSLVKDLASPLAPRPSRSWRANTRSSPTATASSTRTATRAARIPAGAPMTATAR